MIDLSLVIAKAEWNFDGATIYACKVVDELPTSVEND